MNFKHMCQFRSTLLISLAAVVMTGNTVEAANGTAQITPYAFCPAWPSKAAEISADYVNYFPGANNWLFSSRDFNPIPAMSDQDIIELRALVSTLASKGVRTLFVVPPVRGLLGSGAAGPLRKQFSGSSDNDLRRSYRSAIAQLASTGAFAPDLLAAIDAEKLPAINRFYRSQDNHWRAEGAQLTARIVADAAKKAVDLSAFPKKKYATKLVGEAPYVVEILDSVKKVCGSSPPKEIEPQFVTESVDTEASQSDLLGTSSVPVALVGTSFSRPDGPYNFSGFLSEYLGVDLLNVAIPGGGLTTSILSYLGSRDFLDSPPALLIWEVRPFDLPNATISRQLTALLTGDCSGSELVASKTVDIQRGVTPLITFDNKTRSGLTGPAYLEITAGDTGINKYTLRMSFSDFTYQDVEMDMTRAAFPPEHYMHPFTKEQLKQLDSISLRPAARSTGKITVSVCKARQAS